MNVELESGGIFSEEHAIWDILPVSFEAAKYVLKSSRELKESGVEVTTFGFTRLTATIVYCLITGDQPKDLLSRGSLPAYLCLWGLGLWLNDWFDQINFKQPIKSLPGYLSSRQNLEKLFQKAFIRKNGRLLSVSEEIEKALTNFDKFAFFTPEDNPVSNLIESVIQIEKQRPRLFASSAETIFTYRKDLNEAVALSLLHTLCLPDSQLSHRQTDSLINYLQATCIIDDLVGIPDDLEKGLPTYATASLVASKDLLDAVDFLQTSREKVEKKEKSLLPSGVEILEQFPKAKKILCHKFNDFVNASSIGELDKIFRVGLHVLKISYPQAYRLGIFQKLLGLKNGEKDRQNFVLPD